MTSQVHPPWWAPCWKFEKLQIMPLEFGYLESSEKSEKKYTNTTHLLQWMKILKCSYKYLSDSYNHKMNHPKKQPLET